MAGVLNIKTMTLANDTMEFKNLDHICLNLLGYQWIHAGPPGTLAVEQITNCFADIPKASVYQALAILDEKGLILLEPEGKSACLTSKGFNHIRSAVTEPVCANAQPNPIFTAR